MAESFSIYLLKILEKNNIRLINGAPYQPHSQGVVERVHRTIRLSLVAKFIEDTNNLNLLCVHHYNNTIHSVTKFTPNEIFYSSDNELFHKVYNNILNYYNKNNKKEYLYKIGEKCLLSSNILKRKNI